MMHPKNKIEFESKRNDLRVKISVLKYDIEKMILTHYDRPVLLEKALELNNYQKQLDYLNINPITV